MLRKFQRLHYRHLLPDLVLITISFYASLFLRLNWEDLTAYLPVWNRTITLFVALRMVTFILMGVYDIMWRYVSLSDAFKIGKSVFVSTLMIITATYVIDIGRLPRATFFIDFFLVTLLVIGARFFRRFSIESSFGKRVQANGRKTLIYGAGVNGRTLAARLSTDKAVGFRLMGFIDDDPEKVGRGLGGIRVLGTWKDLPEVIKELEISEVIVAISKPPGDKLREVVSLCRPFHIKPRLVSALTEETDNNRPIDTFRSIELSDLLSRPSKNMDVKTIGRLIKGCRVLVTGAGGTIGSELARQILAFNPASLLLLDHAEFNLYQIDQELSPFKSDDNHIIPILMDIKDEPGLRRVFEQYSPQLVFHAAAYKHVHLVEANPYPSILNNIKGTKNLLAVALEHQVETFVLISTDKAVNPVGVMGATKRLCELMVASVGSATGKRYCAVRFGNVLGSSGSLIPLLKTQIQNGSPVTITHKDMTRYFMLISEAVSLVLKAGAIAEPGDITLLNMGEPIKIVDVARSLITLMGRTEEECPIVFTGLRPGEKLFEELYMSGQEIKTEDPDILVLPRGESSFNRNDLTLQALLERIDGVIASAQRGEIQAVSLMHALVKASFTGPGKAAEAEIMLVPPPPHLAIPAPLPRATC